MVVCHVFYLKCSCILVCGVVLHFVVKNFVIFICEMCYTNQVYLLTYLQKRYIEREICSYLIVVSVDLTVTL